MIGTKLDLYPQPHPVKTIILIILNENLLKQYTITRAIVITTAKIELQPTNSSLDEASD